MIHVGQKIKEVFDASGMTVVEFAKRINTSRENVYGIFKRKTIDVDQLRIISDVLDYNFFEYFINPIFSPYPKIEELKNKLEIAEKEILYQRQIIQLLEQQNKLKGD